MCENDSCSCAICNEECLSTDIHTINETNYCNKCYEQLHVICFECDKDLDKENETTTTLVNDIYLCNDCLEKYCTKCHECNKYDYDENCHIDHNNKNAFCSDCSETQLTICPDCAMYFENDDVYVADNSVEYCENCLDKHDHHIEDENGVTRSYRA
mgnify:CR=1 FL=1